jgi:hypothetical protein
MTEYCITFGPTVYHDNFMTATSPLRTGIDGSNNGRDTTGDPAEVFNLRGDAFLWALNQARSEAQVRTRHTMEMAPRF